MFSVNNIYITLQPCHPYLEHLYTGGVILFFYTNAVVVEETLTPNDAGRILEELLDAQNHAHLLGLMMNIKPSDVEAIQRMYPQPKERLLHIIITFLNQVEPRPTWRIIVDALRTRTVNLPRLAAAVEATHIPDSTYTTSHAAPTVACECVISISCCATKQTLRSMHAD